MLMEPPSFLKGVTIVLRGRGDVGKAVAYAIIDEVHATAAVVHDGSRFDTTEKKRTLEEVIITYIFICTGMWAGLRGAELSRTFIHVKSPEGLEVSRVFFKYSKARKRQSMTRQSMTRDDN